MEKRIGAAIILIEDTQAVPKLNTYLTDFSDIIIARQGLPLLEKGIRVISLILDGTNDRIGALAGKVGRLPGAKIKTLLTTFKEADHESNTRENSPPYQPGTKL
jgi:putative iron-only hydrogenase system regulator